VISVVVVALIGSVSACAGPPAGPLSAAAATDIRVELPAGYEPSGTVWLPMTRKLVMVDDEGTVSVLDIDTGEGRHWKVGGDLEAVTVDPADETRIFLGVELPAAIWAFDLEAGAVVARCSISVEASGAKPGKKKSGVEALAFVSDTGTAPGGVFWVGTQADGAIHRLRVRWQDGGGCAVEPLDTFTPFPGRGDLADLAWDGGSRVLFALYDRADRLAVLDLSGRATSDWPLPVGEQEGVAVLPCALIIADDASGRVSRYSMPGIGGCATSE